MFPESATILTSWNPTKIFVAIECFDEDPRLPILVRHILISPRTWLAIGAFCIGTSLLLGYHLDQRSADRVLAQKVGNPQTVLVQNFIPELHTNMLNEVHAVGQMVADECIKVNIGTENSPRWINVRPIYAVGDALMPLARQYLRTTQAAQVRPMPRDAAERLRRQRAEIERISGTALAFAIEEAPASETGAADPGQDRFTVLDEAGSLQLVEITGVVVSGSGLSQTISDALLANGTPSVPDSLLISPGVLGAVTPITDATVANVRWWLALTGAVLAIVAMIAPGLNRIIGLHARKPMPVLNVEAHGSFPAIGIFQPIASQDELSMDEERSLSEDRADTPIRRSMSRITDFAASSFGGIRSPR